MRNFSQVYLKRIVSLIVILSLLVASNVVLSEKLTPVSYALYFNHDVEVIEDEGQDVDLLFIGTSRVYCTFVPGIFEEQLGIDCVLNAGSSAQPTVASYYQLKDLVEKFRVHRVILGVTVDQLVGDGDIKQANLTVYDRLSLKNRFGLMMDGFEGWDRLYALYTYRFRTNLSEIPEIADEKSAMIESNFAPVLSDGEYYADKGFIYSQRSCKTGGIAITERKQFVRDDINPEKLAYLDACIALCEENGIEISLVAPPTSVMRLYNIDDYQDADDFYNSYAAEKGIAYYNLNYLVGREDFLPDELMKDYNHVNGEGAYVISEKFCEILEKVDAGEDVSGYFYDDLDGLKEDVHRIVAVKGDVEFDGDSGQAHVSITSLQSDDVTPVYQIEIKPEGEEEYSVLTAWTEETELDLDIPYHSGFSLKISASTGNEYDSMASQVYGF